MELKIGSTAPDFELKDQNGESHKLSDYKTKKVVLYFYPKDDTPGCTKEACDIRDNYGALKKKAMVIGISADSVESHKKFAAKYNLPFLLLADPEKKVIMKYGLWKQKSFLGKKYMGTARTTYIIDKDIIKKIFLNVSVLGHVKEIMDALD